MFSGIVETTSTIRKIAERHGQRIFNIERPRGWKFQEGESVCVEGVCSTVQKTPGAAFQVIYMPETLRRSTLGRLEPGSPVNLERSLRLNSLLGGHLVQGHVDATGRIRKITQEGEARIYQIEVPQRLSKYLVAKGSIAVDGVSLTVVKSKPARFTVSLLDYTLRRTTLGKKHVGDRVNLEVDVLAKYVEKLLAK
ncbi:MAG: riboflavin synthase [Terriglobia bacterium]